MRLSNHGLSMISTTDFLRPLSGFRMKSAFSENCVRRDAVVGNERGKQHGELRRTWGDWGERSET